LFTKDGCRGDLTAASQSLQGGQQGDGPRLFTVVHGERMRDKRHMLEKQTYRLGTMKRKFPVQQRSGEAGCPKKIVKQW